MVLTGSANAVVPKTGSEAYDTSKAALNHLIRELAIGLGPLVRVNGIAPATVVAGSDDVPTRSRDSVAAEIQDRILDESESTESLRSKTGRLLRAANADATADTSPGLRQRYRLAAE